MESMEASQVKQLAQRSQRERLEVLFLEAWLDEFPQLPVPERQFRHSHKRKWRWDYAFPREYLLIDVQGGTFIRGGHSRGVGQDRDFEKYNDAVRQGYRVLLFGTLAMKDPIACVTLVAEVLTNAREIDRPNRT